MLWTHLQHRLYCKFLKKLYQIIIEDYPNLQLHGFCHNDGKLIKGGEGVGGI
jgi:hypothetical protein